MPYIKSTDIHEFMKSSLRISFPAACCFLDFPEIFTFRSSWATWKRSGPKSMLRWIREGWFCCRRWTTMWHRRLIVNSYRPQHCWCFQKSDIHWSTRHDTVGSWPSIYPHYFALKINPRWFLGISEESTVSDSDDALPKTWTYMNPRSWKKNAQKWQVKDECSKMLGLLEIRGTVSVEMFALKIL